MLRFFTEENIFAKTSASSTGLGFLTVLLCVIAGDTQTLPASWGRATIKDGVIPPVTFNFMPDVLTIHVAARTTLAKGE